MSLRRFSPAVAAAGLLFAAAPVSAAVFVSSFSSYVPGTGVGDYQNPAAALGAPHPIVGDGVGFPNILSPFNPAFEPDELTGIGPGGSITLHFDIPVLDVPGPDFGVITNVGLVDASFTTSAPPGTNTNPAEAFGARTANVAVSGNGVDFFPLELITFDRPANYFANAPSPYATTPPTNPVLADFGLPFVGGLTTFDGLDWAGTLAALGGSGGGTWIDFNASGLGSIVAVRFSLPATPPPGSDGRFFIDAVVANNTAVPEPGVSLLLTLAMPLLSRRR